MSSAELWIIASTVIFIALVFRPGKKAITGGLDARRLSIINELDEAHRLRAEAEALLADAKLRHQSAAKDAGEIVAFAREEAARMQLQAAADLKDHVARREKQALDRIAQAEASALADVRNHAVDMAMAASGDLLTQKLSGSDGDRLLDDVIASLPSKFAGAAR
jgi:F-type H+-transporting ATPase subunit b